MRGGRRAQPQGRRHPRFPGFPGAGIARPRRDPKRSGGLTTMQFDSRGLAITTSSAEAAMAIDQAVKAYMDYGTTAGARIKDALEKDPACVLALCIRGYFFL